MPTLRSDRSAGEIIAALDRLSLNGKLPGFEQLGDDSFKVEIFGDPFDRDLVARIATAPDGGSTLTFATKMRAKAPLVLIISIALSIWPGVILMDALIPARWGWWPTWWWYLPLVIVPLPFFLPRIWKKSEAAAADHLAEQIGKIEKVLARP